MGQGLAARGGAPVRVHPFTSWPVHGDLERRLLLDVLDSGVWGFNGPREREFAARFAELCGCREALCVANGSVGLEIALRALDVGPGHEVIVPALTWVATAYAVVQVGAVPVFADVRPEDWCLDPDSVRALLSPRTRAIIPVHLYDQIAEIDEVLQIAREARLHVVEDCAHAHGAQWEGRSVGTFGAVGSFSFQQSKAMTSGEGGALVTDDSGIAERIFHLKNCGRPWRAGGRSGFGGNHRITEFQAAVLLAQLERLEDHLARKAENARRFRAAIAQVPGLRPTALKGRVTRPGMYGLTLCYDSGAFADVPREVLIDALQAEGLPVQRPYDPVYRSPLWAPEPTAAPGGQPACPVAERIGGSEGLMVPHEVFLGGPDDVDDLVEGFSKVQRWAGELRWEGVKRRVRTAARAILSRR